MKQTHLSIPRTFLVLILVGILVLSCKKDEPFYQVSNFEMELHHNVNKYRQSEGLSSLVFFQDLFVEARQQSDAWKNSGDASEGLQERVDKIFEHWEPVNFDVLLSTINGKDTTAARIVVDYWKFDSAMSAVLRDDFIQSGPGMAEADDGTVYITYFFMKIHD
jgi:hypothetical protein